MDQATEKQLLATLYDRLHDAISYVPEGKTAADNSKTRLLMAKNLVVSEKDMVNALSPLNPGKTASSSAAKAFSDIVDPVPVDGVEWIPTTNRVSQRYERLIKGANAKPTADNPVQLQTYQRAKNYLLQSTTIEDFNGNKTTTPGPTSIARTYNNNQSAYTMATQGYRTAYTGYDLSKTDDQRQWNVVEPMLNLTLQQAWNKWVEEGKAQVEEARAALETTINHAVPQALQAARQLLQDDHKQAPLALGTDRWLLSYAQPSNWLDWQLQGAKLKLRSEYLSTTHDSSATAYAAGGGGLWGLWNFGGKIGKTEQRDHARMTASNFSLEADLLQVRIVRPWYDPQVFSMPGWYNELYKSLAFGTEMPLVATSMIVARNVKITADSIAQDWANAQKSEHAQAGIGWGPFGVSGSYASSASGEKFTSKIEGGSLQLPGQHIIAFMCTRTPPCPPMEG